MSESLTEYLWEENPFFLGFFCLLLFVAGIVVFIYNHTNLKSATQQAPATIVNTYETLERLGGKFRLPTGVTYHVVYEFPHQGKTITGGQEAPRGEREEWEKKYVTEGTITIWYNPGDPSISYIEKRHWRVPFILIAVGLLMTVGCIWRGVKVLRWRKESYEKIL